MTGNLGLKLESDITAEYNNGNMRQFIVISFTKRTVDIFVSINLYNLMAFSIDYNQSSKVENFLYLKDI